ncbi:MAG: CoA transferase [Ectothiorhodospiraceae bacterium]|nr:CoA transferase [Chromatiales bacterium]MCP5154667.1 CoA transferase [Ectothiorhodospiraceae bacterium]
MGETQPSAGSAPAAPALLSGMRVASFCHFLQGPAGTQYLADMGADVVKVEPPRGAWERHWAAAGGARVGEATPLFLCGNRNKRSLAIDLKHPRSKEVVFRLIERSHVMVENFRPGALDRLGFGYDEVRRRKPDIIYASASGYGGSGPFLERPGQDLLAQAMSGLIASSARPDGQPTAVGCAGIDQHGAALLALGIVGAYVRWLQTGEGTRVESSLLSAGIDLQAESLTAHFAAGRPKGRADRDPHLATWFHEAPYGVYRLADCHVVFSMNKLDALGDALGRAEVAACGGLDPYLERDRIARTLAAAVADLDYATVAARLEPRGLWFARVDDFDDLEHNPQVRHNGTFREVTVGGRQATLVTHPVRYDGAAPEIRGLPERPGQDSRAILGELGYASSDIDGLVDDGVIVAGA